MVKNRKKYWVILGVILFVVYIFAAAQPIPVETVLSPRWLASLESGYPVVLGPDTQAADRQGKLLPFKLGGRFGYVNEDGGFVLNRPLKNNVSLSEDRWAEYEADPQSIEVQSPEGERLLNIENIRGYPFFLDNRIFLVGAEQNSLSALDEEGKVLWKYDFAAPLTCIDAAAGYVLTGSLDGVVEILDGEGKRAFFFEPGGSRLSLILGCALSRDGNRMAIISGIDDQRFLVLERYGESIDYKVVYHEFLEDGFRRAVQVSFIDQDSRIVYERERGIGIYEIDMRNNIKIPLDGEITAIDGSGPLLFVIVALNGDEKQLTAIRLPSSVILRAPFKSEEAFLGRDGSRLYVGGGHTLAAFDLESR